MQVQEKIKHQKVNLNLITDPVKSAKTAGLRYVSDDRAGITRKRVGRGFSYFDVNGDRIQDDEMRDYLKSLAIPPAWEEVWICPSRNGHLLATGRDEKGRKQYRYHPQWCKFRSQNKFNRMIPFGLNLPLIRGTTDKHLSKKKLSREKVLAVVVQLLEKSLIRVGNNYYAQENEAFGLTTMRDRHVEISESKVKFEFRGKRGIQHEIELRDRRLARMVKRCRDIPGYELFQYYDEEDKRHTINSEDVNEYLQEITGEEFTAKDFRTWGGTVTAALTLKELGEFETKKEGKKNICEAVKEAAKHLGNRPATCRNYYIHPAITEAYLEGELLTIFDNNENKIKGLYPEESAILTILRTTNQIYVKSRKVL